MRGHMVAALMLLLPALVTAQTSASPPEEPPEPAPPAAEGTTDPGPPSTADPGAGPDADAPGDPAVEDGALTEEPEELPADAEGEGEPRSDLFSPPAEPYQAPRREDGSPPTEVARATPIQQALLGAFNRRKPSLLLSLTASEQYFSNYIQSGEQIGSSRRTGLAGAAAWNRLGAASFLNLAGTYGLVFDRRGSLTRRGQGSLSLRAGHNRPRLKIAVYDSAVRSDLAEEVSSVAQVASGTTFLRNQAGVNLSYALSPLSSFNLGTVGTVSHSEDSPQGTTLDQAVTAGWRRRLTPTRTATAGFGLTLTRADGRPDSLAYRATAGLTDTIGRNYLLRVAAQGSIADRDGTPTRRLLDAQLTVRRRLTSTLGVVGGGSVSSFNPQGQGQKTYFNWIAYLDGPLPIPFLDRSLSRSDGVRTGGFSLVTDQSVVPTGDSLDYQGYQLRQVLRIGYSQPGLGAARLSGFVDLTRSQLLELLGPSDQVVGQTSVFWNLGADLSLPMGRVLALTGAYRHVRRQQEITAPAATDHQVSIVLTSSFSPF